MFIVLKKANIILYLCIFITFITAVYSYSAYFENTKISTNSNTIVIDPGHGGMDGGAVGKTGTLEKDLNLSIALKLKNKLLDNGFNVILTRDTDTMLNDKNEKNNKKRSDLNNRVKIANKVDDGLFISIHMNYFGDESQNGSQIFYSKNNEKSKIFAEILETNLRENLDNSNKRVSKPADNNIFIMKHITIPACLIECGFISNYNDEKKLKNDDYQNMLVSCIINSIKKYMNI